MTKAPTPTGKSKKQRDNTKTPPKTSITQRLRTDLGRSVGVTTATQLALRTAVHVCPQHYMTCVHAISHSTRTMLLSTLSYTPYFTLTICVTRVRMQAFSKRTISVEASFISQDACCKSLVHALLLKKFIEITTIYRLYNLKTLVTTEIGNVEHGLVFGVLNPHHWYMYLVR